VNKLQLDLYKGRNVGDLPENSSKSLKRWVCDRECRRIYFVRCGPS